MSIWQAAYLTLLIAALALAWWRDRSFPSRLSLVMGFNLLGTAALSTESLVAVADGPTLLVAAVDTISAALLVLGTRREMAVAALFLLMVFVHVGAFYLALSPLVLYSVMDGIAYLQCILIGAIGGGRNVIHNSYVRFGRFGSHTARQGVSASGVDGFDNGGRE